MSGLPRFACSCKEAQMGMPRRVYWPMPTSLHPTTQTLQDTAHTINSSEKIKHLNMATGKKSTRLSYRNDSVHSLCPSTHHPPPRHPRAIIIISMHKQTFAA